MILGILALSVIVRDTSAPQYQDLEWTNQQLVTEIRETQRALQVLSDSVESVRRRGQVLRLLAGVSPLDSAEPDEPWPRPDSPLALGRDATRTAPAPSGGLAEVSEPVLDLTPAAPTGRVSSRFALERLDPLLNVVRPHQGVDFPAPPGTAIRAPAAGVVVEVQSEAGYGEYVTIDHGHGVVTRYAHCSDILVLPGARVRRGQKIALVGSTGEATGPHLHFEVWVDGRPVDPQRFIAPGDVITD